MQDQSQEVDEAFHNMGKEQFLVLITYIDDLKNELQQKDIMIEESNNIQKMEENNNQQNKEKFKQLDEQNHHLQGLIHKFIPEELVNNPNSFISYMDLLESFDELRSINEKQIMVFQNDFQAQIQDLNENIEKQGQKIYDQGESIHQDKLKIQSLCWKITDKEKEIRKLHIHYENEIRLLKDNQEVKKDNFMKEELKRQMEELKRIHEHELAETAKIMQESNDAEDLKKLLNKKIEECQDLKMNLSSLKKSNQKREQKQMQIQQTLQEEFDGMHQTMNKYEKELKEQDAQLADQKMLNDQLRQQLQDYEMDLKRLNNFGQTQMVLQQSEFNRPEYQTDLQKEIENANQNHSNDNYQNILMSKLGNNESADLFLASQNQWRINGMNQSMMNSRMNHRISIRNQLMNYIQQNRKSHVGLGQVQEEEDVDMNQSGFNTNKKDQQTKLDDSLLRKYEEQKSQIESEDIVQQNDNQQTNMKTSEIEKQNILESLVIENEGDVDLDSSQIMEEQQQIDNVINKLNNYKQGEQSEGGIDVVDSVENNRSRSVSTNQVLVSGRNHKLRDVYQSVYNLKQASKFKRNTINRKSNMAIKEHEQKQQQLQNKYDELKESYDLILRKYQFQIRQNDNGNQSKVSTEDKNEIRKKTVLDIFNRRHNMNIDPINRINVLNIPSIVENSKIGNSVVDNVSSKNSVSDFIIDKDSNTDNRTNRKPINENSASKLINENIKQLIDQNTQKVHVEQQFVKHEPLDLKKSILQGIFLQIKIKKFQNKNQDSNEIKDNENRKENDMIREIKIELENYQKNLE